MSKIDDIFKEGLDGKGLPYNEAHWQKVEQSIPAKASFSWFKLGIAVTSVATIGVATYFILATVQSTPTQYNKKLTVTENVVLSEENPNTEFDSESDKTISITESPEETSFDNSSEKTPIQKKNTDDFRKENQNRATNQFSRNSEDNQRGALKSVNTNPKPEVNPISLEEDPQSISNSYTHNDIIDQLKKLSNTTDLSLGLKQDKHTINASKKIRKIKPPYRSDWRYFISPFTEYAINTDSKELSGTVLDELGNIENSESVNTFNYGLQLRAQRGKWSIGSGFMLTSINERTNFISSESSYTYQKGLRVVDSEYTTTPRGTRVVLVEQVIVDSTQVITQSIDCEDCQNEINYLTIPLFVRYSFGKSRLSYFGELGGTLAFLQKNHGQFAVIENTTNSMAIRSLESADLNSTVLSITMNAGAQYRISNRFSAWTSLGVRNSRTSTFTNLNHLTNVTALKLGVEYRLK